MFTGIVEEVGAIKNIKRGQHSAVLTIQAKTVLEGTRIGDSIAVNGICLTVTRLFPDGFSADVMHETLNRSSLAGLAAGSMVNLERAMAANGRFGATTVTYHSIGMITEDGLRVFIHVGLGTVEMNGKGFARFVEMGDVVKAGQPLISFDRDAIKAAGHEDIVTGIVSELDRLKSIDHVGESGTLIGGNPLVKLGDPLLVAKTK